MKALLLGEAGGLALTEMETPKPGRGDVLVRMRASGVCGTDIEKARGHGITSTVLGHEVVGEVAELGGGVDGVSVGDRVFTHHHMPCLECDVCLRGEFTLCPRYGTSNIVPGGFAEYYVVPEWNVKRGAVQRLPEGLGYLDATFIEPLACCLRAISKVVQRPARRVLIYGAGPVGMLHLKLLCAAGASIVEVADVSRYRLDFAKSAGADAAFGVQSSDVRNALLGRPDAEKPDLVVVATGNPSAFEDALGAVAKGGTVLLFGAPTRGSMVSVDLDRFFLRGASVVSSYSAGEKETLAAARMLAAGEVSVSELVTHVFPLEQAVRAFEVAKAQECMKAAVTG